MAANYPDASDLSDYLTSLSVLDATGLTAALTAMNLQAKLDAAAAAWERQTGWHPFLSTLPASARLFDPPGGYGNGKILELGAGIVTLTSLYTGYSPTSAGSAQTVGSDFWLAPGDAPANGRPYDHILFACAPGGDPQSIRITATWGYAATVPEDVFQAVLAGAALRCVPELSLQVSRGLASIKTPATTINFATSGGGRYGSGPLAGEAERWAALWEETLADYRRVSL